MLHSDDFFPFPGGIFSVVCFLGFLCVCLCVCFETNAVSVGGIESRREERGRRQAKNKQTNKSEFEREREEGPFDVSVFG